MSVIKKQRGFTLIEVMIVVAIVAIIAAIAIPSYSDYLVRARRADAQQVLEQLDNAMQRYRVEQTPYTYVGAALGAGGIFPSQAPLDGAVKHYNLVIANPTATSYELQAFPIAGSTQVRDGALELTSTGIRRWDRGGDGTFDVGTDDCWAKTC